MNLARMFSPRRSDSEIPAGTAHPTAPAKEPLLRQFEDDFRFALRMIGSEVENASAGADESAARAERLREASESFRPLLDAAREVYANIGRTSAKLESAAQAAHVDAADLECLVAKILQNDSDVGLGLRRLEEAVEGVDVSSQAIAILGRQLHVLALNADMEAARAAPASVGAAALAQGLKSLAERTSSAAAELSVRMGALREATRRQKDLNGREGLADLGLEPRLGALRETLGGQARGLGAISRHASEAARLSIEASERSEDLAKLCNAASIANKRTKRAVEGVHESLGYHSRRSTALLRGSVWGNRRSLGRTPVKAFSTIWADNDTFTALCLDLSVGGALLIPHSERTPPSGAFQMSLSGVGECLASVVGISEIGWHVRFDAPDAPFLNRARELIDNSSKADAAVVKAVQCAAADASRAFDQGVAGGDVRLEELITTTYRRIEASDPARYQTGALTFYERVLPPLCEALWVVPPFAVYAMAADRNGYVPCDRSEALRRDRAQDRSWDEAPSRDRQFLDAWSDLIACRNTEPVSRRVTPRRTEKGGVTPIKTFSSPIHVAGRLWGNFHLGVYF